MYFNWFVLAFSESANISDQYFKFTERLDSK